MVTRVDMEGRVADLSQRAGMAAEVETNVPFHLIRTVPREASRVIQAFLLS